MNAKEYVSLLFPNGRAYAGVEDSEKFNEVIALQVDRVIGWVQDFQDQLWFINSNFDPEPWELRYNIEVPLGASLDERRQTVKSYMIFPQSANRLSLDYIQNQLIIAGFDDVLVERNPTGVPSGTLHANNITGNESYTIGSEPYNSFNISGQLKANYYSKMMLLLMSIKPLDSAIYDTVTFDLTLAISETLALAFDETLTLATSQI